MGVGLLLLGGGALRRRTACRTTVAVNDVSDSGAKQVFPLASWERSQEALTRLVEKFSAGEIDQACVLVNNATETAWCQRLIATASAICFVRGPVRFLLRGDVSGAPLQGQIVLYLGGRPEAFSEHFTQLGQVWRSQ